MSRPSSANNLSRNNSYSLDFSLCDPPVDILPPSPPPSKSTLPHAPFLFTNLAKSAFLNAKSERPGSADILSGRERSGSQTGSFSMGRPRRKFALRSEGSIHERSFRSGRDSAPPFASASSMPVNLMQILSQSKFKRAGSSQSKMSNSRSLRKKPEIRALEAEQRSIEAEQKAAERQMFEKQKEEATVYNMQLTKQYNDLKKHRMDLERQYALLIDRKAAIDAEAKSEDRKKILHNEHKIQDLEAKLEYWTEALREEESYTKTLLHMQTRCASEKHSRDIETMNFKDLLDNHDHDIRALQVRLQEAKSERDAAERQVSDYYEHMQLYRERREERLTERRRKVQKMQLKDEALKKLIAEEEELARQKNLQDLAANREAAAQQRLKDKFHTTLEDAFQKMMSISGIQTLEELQDAILNRDQKQQHFETLLEHNKTRIDELSDLKRELELELMKIKYSGSANDAEREEIEEVIQQLCEWNRFIFDSRTDSFLSDHAKKDRGHASKATIPRIFADQDQVFMHTLNVGLFDSWGNTRSGMEFLSSKLVHVEVDQDESISVVPQEDSNASPDETSIQWTEMPSNAESAEDFTLSQVVPGESFEEETLNDPEHLLAMKKVEHPKIGVVAMLYETSSKLAYVYKYLKHVEGQVPAQAEESIRSLRAGHDMPVGLIDLKNNYRLPLSRVNRSPRRTHDEEDQADTDDRNAIKMKSERIVARKKKELASRFDEFGNEIAVVDNKSKKK
eukprot:751856-Hanusia_phi.AAC.8